VKSEIPKFPYREVQRVKHYSSEGPLSLYAILTVSVYVVIYAFKFIGNLNVGRTYFDVP
jgi:hypothetical protein